MTEKLVCASLEGKCKAAYWVTHESDNAGCSPFITAIRVARRIAVPDRFISSRAMITAVPDPCSPRKISWAGSTP